MRDIFMNTSDKIKLHDLLWKKIKNTQIAGKLLLSSIIWLWTGIFPLNFQLFLKRYLLETDKEIHVESQ